MNQSELNQIAHNFILDQSLKTSVKLNEILGKDYKERSKKLSGQAIHHIHNMSVYECLIWLNSIVALNDASEETIEQYYDYADSLRSQYFDIVEKLKDFQPPKNNK